MPNNHSLLPLSLVEYLYQKYVPRADCDSVTSFVTFCRGFMEKNRPSTLTNVEGNFIIKLTNGDEVAISPPEPRDGSMQRSGRAIPVTGADTAREILSQGGP